jgi:hypothetical protein
MKMMKKGLFILIFIFKAWKAFEKGEILSEKIFLSQYPQLDEADSKEYSFEEMSLESWAAAESKNCELDPTNP